MVYCRISPDMKQRSLQLIDEGWEMENVANVLGVAFKSIGWWTDNHNTHGCIDPPSVLRGCPCILNSEAISDLHELICGTPTLFLDDIGEWLALYHDQPISTTTLHDNLRKLGLTYKILQKATAEHDDQTQAEWLIYITSNYTAGQMVVLDEFSKDGWTILWKYGWALSGQDPFLELSFDQGIFSQLWLWMVTLLFVLLKGQLMVQSSMTLLSMTW